MALAVATAGAASGMIILTATREAIHAGESTVVTATVTDAPGNVVGWSVSEGAPVDYYVSGNECLIIGKETDSAKKVIVTAMRYEDVESIVITVEPSIKVALDKADMSIEVGGTGQLKAELPPSEGAVYWSSSDNAVAKVDSSGLVTGVGEGTAVISAMTGGGKSASCKVTVKAAVPLTDLKLDKSASLMVGGVWDLTAATVPEGRPVQFASGDSSIAEVDANGRVTGISAGSTVITATAGKFTRECTVKVLDVLSLSAKRMTVGLESSAGLTALVAGVPATAADVVWSTSDPSVAELSGSGGQQVSVLGKAEGEADITATLTVDGTPAAYTAICRVKVAEPVRLGVTVYGKYLLENPGGDGERSIAGQLSDMLEGGEALSQVEFESVEDGEGNRLEADAGKRYACKDINSLCFVPASGFTGEAVFPFTAVGGQGSIANGELVFKVREGGGTPTLYLNAGDDGSAMLRTGLFETLWKAAFPEGKLGYIQFTSVSGGAVYSGVRTVKAGEKCYLSPEGYALGIYGLRFVPDAAQQETVALFTAVGTDKTGRSVKKDGRLLLVRETDGNGTVTLAYNCDSSGVAFDANTFFSGGGPLRNAAYLVFDPPAAGGLTVTTVSGPRPAREDDCFAAYSTPGFLGISALSYVPDPGSAGTVDIPFSAYSAADALLAQGIVRVSVLSAAGTDSGPDGGTGSDGSTGDGGGVPGGTGSAAHRPPATAASFPDVTADDWYYTYVMELTGTGIVNGYPDGTYRPAGNVTNGESLKLIMLACGYGELEGGEDWLSGYVAQAAEDGIIGGTFDPYAPATRTGFAEMAARAMGVPPAPDGASPFVDTSDRWARALYGYTVDGERIISGLYDESGQLCFHPDAHITRAEAAKIVTLIYRAGPFVAALPSE